MSEWLPRMHALVIGPGLGRSPATLSNVKEIIAMAIKHETSLVIDAVSMGNRFKMRDIFLQDPLESLQGPYSGIHNYSKVTCGHRM